MIWILFVIITCAIWATTNIVDRVVLSGKVRYIYSYLFFGGIVGIIPLLAIPFYGLASPEPWIIFFGIISGMLYIYALIPYFKMLTLEEVSRIIPIWRFIPLRRFVSSFQARNVLISGNHLAARPIRNLRKGPPNTFSKN